MQSLLNPEGCTLLTPIAGSVKWRCLLTILLGILGSSVTAQSEVLAQKATTLELSPWISKSLALSPVDGTKEISVVLVLPLRDATAAAKFAERVATPKDLLYGKYLTPQEFATRFGANEEDYAVVKSWAITNGLKISDESISRTTLTARGTVAQIEALFNTQLGNYRGPDRDEFYSADTKPTIPSSIAPKLIGVIGLTNSRHYASLAKVYKKFGETPATKLQTDSTGGTGPGGAYSAADLRTAYSIGALGGTVPQTVAVFEQGGFAESDVKKYLSTNNLPDVPVKPRKINGFGGGINDPGVELEAVLDIDMIIGINPAVKEVLVYEDGDDSFGVALLDALADVANDNVAQTFSISYGDDEVNQGPTQIAAEGQVLTQLAAQGISVFASSGDQGAYGRTFNGTLNVSDPASQPFVTAVGGTTLYTGAGSVWADEQVWNLLVDGYGATGGGASSYWTIPSYQPHDLLNGCSTAYRNLPDIAAVGNPLTGVAVYSKINGGWIQIGGTSVSSPIWAGYISLLNSAYQTVGFGRIGFFNPGLYLWVGLDWQYFFTLLHDIVDGTNSISFWTPGYTAGLAFDDCSGWG